MADPTVADVEAVSSTSWEQLDIDKKQALLDDAIREAESIYTGRFARLPTIEGDETIFKKYLAAHKWEIAEGGEPQSESAGGGSVTYNTVTGDALSNLQQTRYGREALNHVRDEQGIAIERSRF